MTRGDRASFSLIAKDEDGDIINITGYDLIFTVKRNKPDTSVILQSTIANGNIVINDGAAGTFTVYTDEVDTADLDVNSDFSEYYYDVESEVSSNKLTLFAGILRIYPDITDTDAQSETITGAYNTLATAQTYMDKKLRTREWDSAVNDDKIKALLEAHTIIEQLNYRGKKTAATQTNQFPRYDDSTVPAEILYAEAEIALSLLKGYDPDIEINNLRMVSQGYDSMKTTYDPNTRLEHIAAGIPSATAWRFIKPYLRDYLSFRRDRVS